MTRSLFLALLALNLCGSALMSAAQEASETVLLRGLVLLKPDQEVLKQEDPKVVEGGLHVGEIALLQGEEFRSTIEGFFGRPINEALLKELQIAVVSHYRKAGYPLVDPYYPQQTVSQGVLQMVVLESKLGQVVFEGAHRWTSTDYLRKNLTATEGELINEKELTSDLLWLKQNRFRTVDLYFKPGESRGESDLVVRTSERFPLGAFASIDNTGNRLTGETRFSTGLEWGKAFGLTDHQLTYRFSADIDFDLLNSHSVGYSIPLPWRHTLRLLGAYSDVEGEIPRSPLRQKGESILGSFRYEIPLPNIRNYRQEFTLGGDFRRLDNNLEFNFINVFGDTTEIFQGMLGYSGVLPDDWGGTAVGAEYFYSPGGITGKNTDRAFRTSFPFSEAQYQYARFNLERLTRLPAGFSWRMLGAFQVADGNLVPSEQMGLGGGYTVRGYEERAVSGAEGVLLSAELRAPAFSLGGFFDKTAKDELQFLGFFDYGQTSNRTLLRGEDPHRVLKSLGLGLRYRVSRFVTVRFDYGWQLDDPGRNVDPDNSRGHVFAEIRF